MLVTPPLLSKTPAKPLQVYSRCRFHHCMRGPARFVVTPPVPSLAAEVAPARMAAEVVAICMALSLAALVDDPTASLVGVGLTPDLNVSGCSSTAREGVAPSAIPSVIENPPPLPNAWTAFIDKLAQHVAGLLLVSAINKHRGRTLPTGDIPQRSQHLAGVKTEFGLNDLERRTKKKAIRSLELIEENESIDQQALDDYVKLFRQPLPDSHL